MKFFIALILALAIFSFSNAQSTPGGYTPIKFSPNNKQLVAILNFGVNQAVPRLFLQVKFLKVNGNGLMS